MSERKVLNKYYPPDFDPSKIPRLKRISKQHKVRTMAPFNMRCNTCGDYIAKARKFNARKETVTDESYIGLSVFRFYIKCPKCMAEITFKTDPKEADYVIEHGATQNFMALKMAEKQAEDDAIAEEEEEKINPMKHLENRTNASKNEMEASEQIQNLRLINQRQISVDLDSILADTKHSESLEAQKQLDEDLILAKSIIAQRRAAERDALSLTDPMTSTSRSIPVKKKKVTGIVIKPKASGHEEMPATTTPDNKESTGGAMLRLCAYPSSEDDDD